MASNTSDVTFGEDAAVLMKANNSGEEKSPSYFKTEIKLRSIIAIFILNIIMVYGFLTFPYSQKLKSFLFQYSTSFPISFGITGGAHQFWTHRSYKAKWPLRIILLSCFYMSGQNTLYQWVRDHRVHHKYSETDADPHNSKRGFFFSHVGWLMIEKHSEVIKRGRQIDMSDILSDPIVAFGEKYFAFFKILFCFVIPTIIPVYFWNEEWYYSIILTFMRYGLSLHYTWSVNSFAHIWGYKPYDKSIAPVENKYVSYITMGEGWHNYHHVFPYDYKCAEFGHYSLNLTACIIDMFAKIGWTYDLKQAPKELIQTMKEKRGHESHNIKDSKITSD